MRPKEAFFLKRRIKDIIKSEWKREMKLQKDLNVKIFPEEIRKEIHCLCVKETVVRLREASKANGTKALKL